MAEPDWTALRQGLSGLLFAVETDTRLRAYPYIENFDATQINTDTRLIGRSVWNTKWLLVIPGTTLLGDPDDPDKGIETFIEEVTDIYIYFQTYSYAGN